MIDNEFSRIINDNRDNVESDIVIEIFHPYVTIRRPNQIALFEAVNSDFRSDQKRSSPRLDFDNDYRFFVFRDNIDFLVSADPVSFEDGVTFRRKIFDGLLFTEPA